MRRLTALGPCQSPVQSDIFRRELVRAPWLKYIFDSITKTRNREGRERERGGKRYSANQGKGPQKKD